MKWLETRIGECLNVLLRVERLVTVVICTTRNRIYILLYTRVSGYLVNERKDIFDI